MCTIMTKNNTAAVEFHRCSRMRMQWIPGALFFSPVSPAPPFAPPSERLGPRLYRMGIPEPHAPSLKIQVSISHYIICMCKVLLNFSCAPQNDCIIFFMFLCFSVLVESLFTLLRSFISVITTMLSLLWTWTFTKTTTVIRCCLTHWTRYSREWRCRSVNGEQLRECVCECMWDKGYVRYTCIKGSVYM